MTVVLIERDRTISVFNFLESSGLFPGFIDFVPCTLARRWFGWLFGHDQMNRFMWLGGSERYIPCESTEKEVLGTYTYRQAHINRSQGNLIRKAGILGKISNLLMLE